MVFLTLYGPGMLLMGVAMERSMPNQIGARLFSQSHQAAGGVRCSNSAERSGADAVSPMLIDKAYPIQVVPCKAKPAAKMVDATGADIEIFSVVASAVPMGSTLFRPGGSIRLASLD